MKKPYISPRSTGLLTLVGATTLGVSLFTAQSVFAACGDTDTALLDCSTSENGVWDIILVAINVLTAGVGVLAVGGIVYGAILYTSAEDKADQVKKATDIITNVIIGLVAFALMWAGLNFLIPGGVFNREFNLPPQVAPSNPPPGGNNGGNNSDDDRDGPDDIKVADIRLRNFRDATTTSSGKVLRRDILYRSAALNNIRDGAREKLGTLLGRNAVIIDVRTVEQRSADPDKPIPGTRKVNIPTGGFLDTAPAVTDPARRRALGQTLRTAANANGAVLIHCAAGKDRTGWLVAMIMHVNGASEAQIMREYMKSEEDWPNGVKPEWLRSGLSAARNQYGSIDSYLKRGLGLSDGDLRKLRQKFGA